MSSIMKGLIKCSFPDYLEEPILMDLASAFDEEDIDKFTSAVREFDSMTRLGLGDWAEVAQCTMKMRISMRVALAGSRSCNPLSYGVSHLHNYGPCRSCMTGI
ncbi:hypothetical protein EJ110_NYTH39434 [Nymphaea thermarum]|nr:hypothetical protein EJ110_NYTH39434 [Nymphaea thermarum]